MEIREIASKDQWGQFLAEAKPHTFLHSWQWGEFNEKIGNKIWRLGIFENGELVGAALIIKIDARRGSFLFCPHGPITKSYELRSHKILSEYLRGLAEEERVAFIRISPLLPATDENVRIFKDLKFQDAPVHMMHPEFSWILDITPSEEIILKNMRKQTRHCIRNAKMAGVEISMSNDPFDLAEFHKLYKSTATRQDFIPFSKKYLEEEFETFVKDNSALLFFGKYRQQIVSSAMIIFTNYSAFYHHGCSDPKFSKIPASHLLQWEIIREAKRRGCRYYNFWGIAPQKNANHPWVSLSIFKRGFGGFSEDYMHAQDFILSNRYWINFFIEKIRRFKRNY